MIGGIAVYSIVLNTYLDTKSVAKNLEHRVGLIVQIYEGNC